MSTRNYSHHLFVGGAAFPGLANVILGTGADGEVQPVDLTLGKHRTFVQSTPAINWSFEHDFGSVPTVVVLDNDGVDITASVNIRVDTAWVYVTTEGGVPISGQIEALLFNPLQSTPSGNSSSQQLTSAQVQDAILAAYKANHKILSLNGGVSSVDGSQTKTVFTFSTGFSTLDFALVQLSQTAAPYQGVAQPLVERIGTDSLRLTMWSNSGAVPDNAIEAFVQRYYRDEADSSETPSALSGFDSATTSYLISDDGSFITGSNTAGSKKSPIQIIFDGDSLTYGYGGSHSYGGTTVANLTSAGFTQLNYLVPAISGQNTDQILARQQSSVIANYDPQKNNIVVLWAGTNDIGQSKNIQTTYANLVSYCRAALSAGFKVIVTTLTPNGYSTAPYAAPANEEQQRAALNAMILNINNDASGVSIVDLASDPIVGSYANRTNSTYFFDGCHLTDAGYDIVANLITAKIETLFN